MASARRRARDARDACLQSRRGAASVASGAGMALSGMLVAAPLANAASWTVAEAPLVDRFVSKSARDYEMAWR